MQLILGARIKIEPLVEFPRLLIDSMNQYGADAEDVRRSFDAKKSIFEQRSSNSVPLLLSVDRQPRQKADWNGMVRKPVSRTASGSLFRDAASGNRIVTNHAMLAMNYIGSGAIIRLVLQRIFLQPEVQRLVRAAIEFAQIMGLAQRFNLRERRHLPLLQHARLGEELS